MLKVNAEIFLKLKGMRSPTLVVIRTNQVSTSQNYTMKACLPLRAGLAASLLLFAAVTPPALAIAEVPLLTAQVPSNATILYVNPSLGTDADDAGSSENTAFRTITYALQQAQPSTIIQLAAGSYTRDGGEVFPLTIGEGISLRGNESNKGQTVLIIGSGVYLSPSFAGQNVTLRALNGGEIRGITVTNPNTRGTGVWIEQGSPTIRNNTFSNSLREGVFVSGTATPTIADNLFTNNDGNGISLARAAGGEIRDNVIQDTGFGIAIGGTSTPSVRDNQVTGNVDGIVVNNSARPVLRDNVIENNERDGVVAIATAQPDLGTTDSPGGNTIRNNRRHDLNNATSSNTILAVGNQIDPDRITGEVEFVASTSNSQFSDVQGHWAEAYITALASREVVSGFPDGRFHPDDPVTRAQFAAMVAKAFSPSPTRAPVSFRDVRANFWGNQVIQTAYRGGFLAGYPGQRFQPEQQIPRVQALVSLASGLQLSSGSNASLDRYQDAAEIPDWARDGIAAATERSIVVSYPTVTQLAPNQQATRAEVAAFIYQALVSTGQAEVISSPYVVSRP
jgi:parallel beta-helix repeat protein